MVIATSDASAYRTVVRSGDLELVANTLKDGVGGTDAFVRMTSWKPPLLPA
jgi:hypothetical protein